MTGQTAPLLIVVPMKDPGASKTRLSAELGHSDRRRLATVLFRRTLVMLGACRAAGGFDFAVVTSSPAAAAIARRLGAGVIDEGAPAGLNAAVTLAAAWAEARGYGRLCVLPADLAAPDPDDLLTLLDHGGDAQSVVICPSTDLGTNALLVSPPLTMTFRYGPHSARRHVEAAEAAGLAPLLLPLESLRYDIDTTDALSHALSLAPDLKAPTGR